MRWKALDKHPRLYDIIQGLLLLLLIASGMLIGRLTTEDRERRRLGVRYHHQLEVQVELDRQTSQWLRQRMREQAVARERDVRELRDRLERLERGQRALNDSLNVEPHP